MAHHLLLYLDVVIHLAIVYLELKPHEAGQYRRGARLCADGRDLLSGLGADDREPARSVSWSRRATPRVRWSGALRDDVGTW